jgi:hypothetical protein
MSPRLALPNVAHRRLSDAETLSDGALSPCSGSDQSDGVRGEDGRPIALASGSGSVGALVRFVLSVLGPPKIVESVVERVAVKVAGLMTRRRSWADEMRQNQLVDVDVRRGIVPPQGHRQVAGATVLLHLGPVKSVAWLPFAGASDVPNSPVPAYCVSGESVYVGRAGRRVWQRGRVAHMSNHCTSVCL